MLFSTTQILSTLLASLSLATAQTYTSCNPLKQTCPSNPGLLSKSLSTDFTKGSSSDWTLLNGTVAYTSAGASFTINNKNDAPTIATGFYLLFGYVEVKLRAAPGVGVVSAVVLQSDDLDEIDWEILGGSPNNVQSNYFGKGDTSSYTRGQTHAISASTTTYHTYGIEWTSSAVTWSIDGSVVRKLSAAEAGKNFPQTPCQLRIGNWPAGSSPNPGTVTWAGGATDFSKAPFSMYVSSVSVVNYNPATSYTYSDKSGTWQSIKMAGGDSVGGNNIRALGSVSVANSSSSVSMAVTSASPSASSATSLSTITRSSNSSATSTTAANSTSASASARATNDAFRLSMSTVSYSTMLLLFHAVLSLS